MQRYTSLEFPPYAFVPGRNPHPKSNPEGHSFGKVESIPEKLDLLLYKQSVEYLYGIDLFNYGYYWEAHEVWEGLWNAHKREGNIAEFLKALIKLTAAGVKVKQGKDRGINDHSLAAGKIFKDILANTKKDKFLGLSLNKLIDFTDTNIIKVEKKLFADKNDNMIVFDQLLEII